MLQIPSSLQARSALKLRLHRCLGALDLAVERMQPQRAWMAFAVIVALFVGIAVTGFTLLARTALNTERARLDSIATLEAQEIDTWLREAIDDVDSLTGNVVFRELLTQSRTRGASHWNERLGAWADAQRATAWLQNSMRIHEYRSVEVVDEDGLLLLGTGSVNYSRRDLFPLIAAARPGQRPVIRDVEIAGDGHPYVLIVARIPDVEGLKPVCLVFSINVADRLLPRLERWPNASRTGDLLLFRQSEGRIALINKPAGSIMSFQTVSLDDPRSPAAKAIAHGDGLYEGIDHRGQAVLAAVRRTQLLPWFVSVRIGTDELMAPIHRLALLCTALAGAGALMTGLLLTLFWRGQTRRLDEAHALNEQLARRSLDAQQATRAKSAFLANMSHEIRTPLNAIVGLTHLLRSRALAGSWESERLSQVSDSAQHLLTIISDVLDISRIESGRLQLEDTEFLLETVVCDKVVNIIGERARAKGLELLVDIDDALSLPLRGDPLRLSQALLNFLSNAIKFTEKGSVTIKAEVAERDAAGVRVRFEVIDTGMGLTPEQCERIFKPFEQADTSTTRKFGGSGLGLAITSQLARLMGGEVGVVSHLGLGSSFWFTARLGLGQTAMPRRSTTMSGKRVLIADDLPEARQVLSTLVRRLGMRSDEVSNGQSALDAIRQADTDADPYHLMLLDWRMPGLDGLGTLRRLSAMPVRVRPSVLVVTAYEDHGMAPLALDAGCTNVLTKPLTASTLVDALANLEGAPRPLATPVGALQCPVARSLVSGRRILLAEDNPVNRAVMAELLAEVGAIMEFAGDGVEAVELASARTYDVLLMDVQMPRMDGLEATRRIRALPGWEHIPILAMTANAFSEDREACMAAGMDDHLSKPVDPDKLMSVLSRWLRPDAGAAAASHGPLADGPAASPSGRAEGGVDPGQVEAIFDPQRLRALMARRPHQMRSVITEFIGHHRTDVVRMQERLAEADLQGAFLLAHALKGGAGEVGALQLAGVAGRIESALRVGVHPGPQDMQDLTEALGRALHAATRWLDEHPAPMRAAVQPHTPVEFLLLVRRLGELLAATDARVLTVADELDGRIPPALSAHNAQRLEQVLAQVREMEMEAAARAILVLLPDIEKELA